MASLGLPQDLITYNATNGNWTVGVSNGASSFSQEVWARWNPANNAWTYIGQGDFNGDGRTDIIGLIGGDWWVGLSNGVNGFTTSLWSQWVNPFWTEIRIGDLNADGRDDVVARTGNEYWAGLSTGTRFVGVLANPNAAPATRWGNAGGIVWDANFLADVNGDQAADLVLLLDGDWFVARSTGTSFTIADPWNITAPNFDWDALTTADMNFDGRADIVAFENGAWYIGFSTGVSFQFTIVAQWANASQGVEWNHLRLGQFDGIGLGDLTGYFAGQWWVTTLTLDSFDNIQTQTRRWAAWNYLADWNSIRVGDFNGDGRDDIAAREGGNWWVGLSTASTVTDAGFATSRWATWLPYVPTYRFVAVAQVNNVASAAPVALTIVEEESAALFWSEVEDDDEFASTLLTSTKL